MHPSIRSVKISVQSLVRFFWFGFLKKKLNLRKKLSLAFLVSRVYVMSKKEEVGSMCVNERRIGVGAVRVGHAGSRPDSSSNFIHQTFFFI